MADVFLILVIVVAFLILLVSSVYFLVHYQHPEDRNTAFFPKLVVLGAFLISGFTVLGLPLDVANNAGYTGMSCCCVVVHKRVSIPNRNMKAFLWHISGEFHSTPLHSTPLSQ
jgi:hypothetical protein